MTSPSGNFTVTRVDELRAEIRFPVTGGIALWELEKFCEALRNAGAPGVLTVSAERRDGTREQGYPIGDVFISAVQQNPRRAGKL